MAHSTKCSVHNCHISHWCTYSVPKSLDVRASVAQTRNLEKAANIDYCGTASQAVHAQPCIVEQHIGITHGEQSGHKMTPINQEANTMILKLESLEIGKESHRGPFHPGSHGVSTH